MGTKSRPFGKEGPFLGYFQHRAISFNVGIGTDDPAGLRMRVFGSVGVWSGGSAVAVAGYGGVAGVGFSGFASGVGGVGAYGGSTDAFAYAGVFEKESAFLDSIYLI